MDVGFGEEGYLEDLEPVVTTIHTDTRDGRSYFAVRPGTHQDADDLLARGGRALGVGGEEE